MEKEIKLYKYENGTFLLQAIIDDYSECSFEHNLYQAGQFTISINYNIPNALLFKRGLFVQIGSSPYDFGEIINITDAIGQDGKGSQRRTITGYDARFLFKRRIIKSLNNENTWTMTAKGELCIRNLVLDQCGTNAETKRQLPIINTIPAEGNAIGKEYSVSESFTNLYDVLTTIATQSEIGWRINFDGSSLSLECYGGTDRSSTVRFDTNYDSLANGQFTDSAESFSNTVYVGGKGQGSERDIYEGEIGTPEGLDRYESWDNQSSMTTESEYEKEALSILTQYGQTLQVNGQGLVKSSYTYREQYEIGDIITIAFSGKSAQVQILSVTENWSYNNYGLVFSFGKPQPSLSDQMQLILKRIQKASEKTDTTDSVKYYTLPTDTSMPASDVIYNRIGFIGSVGEGMTFTLYLDTEKTGAKTYHVYIKELAGSGKLTLTTGFENAQNLVLNVGTYVAIVYVDENGNITMAGSTATNTIESGNSLPATSDAISSVVDTIQGEIDGKVDTDSIVDSIIDGNLNPITSNAVYDGLAEKQDTLTFDSTPTSGSSNPVTSGGVYSAIPKILFNRRSFSSTYHPSAFAIVCNGIVAIEYYQYTTEGTIYHNAKAILDGISKVALIDENNGVSISYQSANERFVIWDAFAGSGRVKIITARVLSGDITTFNYI